MKQCMKVKERGTRQKSMQKKLKGSMKVRMEEKQEGTR